MDNQSSPIIPPVPRDHDYHDRALLTKYLRKTVADVGTGKPGVLELLWELREDCPALAIVAMHYLCIPAS